VKLPPGVEVRSSVPADLSALDLAVDMEARIGPVGLLRAEPRFFRLSLAILISSIGDPLTLAVSLVLLFASTGSPVAVGAAYASRVIAALLVGGLLGSAVDRADRRRLVLALELARGFLVATMPFASELSVFLLYPYLVVLGGAEALVQPARLAAVPELVGRERVQVANSLLVAFFALAQAAGFAVAGVLLAVLHDPRALYWGDALSFVAAGALVASLSGLGGGTAKAAPWRGVNQALRLPEVRPLLWLTAGANLFIGMGTPALLPIAYLLARSGAIAYTALEVALIMGVLVGSAVAARIPGPATSRSMAASLWVFGAASVAMALMPSLEGALVAVAVSGAGNSVYAVANRSALMRAADGGRLGAVMTARFTIGQAAQVLGLGSGALIVSGVGPRWGFAMVGLGLAVLAALYGVHRALETHLHAGSAAGSG
jgi:MFS family permease